MLEDCPGQFTLGQRQRTILEDCPGQFTLGQEDNAGGLSRTIYFRTGGQYWRTVQDNLL